MFQSKALDLHLKPFTTVKNNLFLALSYEPVGGFLPNLHIYIDLWRKKSNIDFGDLDSIFKVTPALF